MAGALSGSERGLAPGRAGFYSFQSMHPARSRTRTLIARALVAGACLGGGALLASCSKDATPLAPIVSTPGPPGPMITVAGAPRVGCSMQVFVNRTVGIDTLSGYFYLVLNDSVPHNTFVGPATLNGVPMRFEVDAFGRPLRYSLRPVDLGPAYAPSDSLHFAIADTTGTTTPFTLTLAPSTLDLPPDSSRLSQRQDLVLHWEGAAEGVTVRISDQNSKRVAATLTFENETGVSQLLIRAQDLAGLAPGKLTVGTQITNSEARAGPLGKPVAATMSVLEARTWQLVP